MGVHYLGGTNCFNRVGGASVLPPARFGGGTHSYGQPPGAPSPARLGSARGPTRGSVSGTCRALSAPQRCGGGRARGGGLVLFRFPPIFLHINIKNMYKNSLKKEKISNVKKWPHDISSSSSSSSPSSPSSPSPSSSLP